MAINKVIYGNDTLIDLTDATATADKILQGYTAYGRDGSKLTGTATTPTLQSKTYTVDSAGTETITADSGYDGLSSVAVSVPSASPYTTLINDHYSTSEGRRKWSITPLTSVDVAEGDVEGWLPDGYYETGNVYEVYAVPSNTTVTPTESSQTIGGSNYMMEGAVTVNAIPSNYVGSGITQRSSSDLTASGATVTVPSGYYSAQASKAVASGTAGTPTATKGTVSNHSVSVTPSVTNTTGYITGSTINGTAVTVTASELASGNKAITQNGTNIDVVGYSTVSVDVSQQFTATIETNGAQSGANFAYVSYNSTKYYSAGSTFTFSEGDSLLCFADAQGGSSTIYVNDEEVQTGWPASYTYTLPSSDISIKLSAVSTTSYVKIYTAGATLITKTITTNGTYDAEDDNADGYSQVIVNVSGGGSVTVTDIANATGTTCVITSSGSTPTEDIPLNTQLIDFTKVTNGYIVDGDTGEETVSQWSSCSDFTLIDPTMTFSYIGYQWYSIVFYDSSKSYISGLNMYQDTGTTITNDYAHGTLTPSKIPSTAKYVRIDSYPTNPSSTQLSLIRTA